jgi:hypothetical protein
MEQVFNELGGLIIPFVVVIFGLVEFLKAAFKLQGRAVTWVSFAVGAIFGLLVFAGYRWPQLEVYTGGLVFVSTSGLVASGYYKFLDARLPQVRG